MKKLLLLVVLLLSGLGLASSTDMPLGSLCSKSQDFCWLGDEVDTYGQRWVQDNGETLAGPVSIRCMKAFRVCSMAENVKVGTETVIRLEMLTVVRWEKSRLVARAEHYEFEPCQRSTYIFNRSDESVILMIEPGPRASGKACTNVVGEPKTAIYRLVR